MNILDFTITQDIFTLYKGSICPICKTSVRYWKAKGLAKISIDYNISFPKGIYIENEFLQFDKWAIVHTCETCKSTFWFPISNTEFEYYMQNIQHKEIP